MRCGSGLSEGLRLICGNNQNYLNDSPSISENSSQSPPHINHHYCYECGDPLDGIFYKRCTYESPFTCDSTPNIVDDSPNIFNPPPQPLKYSYEFCGNDAYYGHDCPHQNSCYNSNSFGFDQFLPQQLPVIDQTPLEEIMKNLRIAFQAWSENIQQKKEEEEKQIAEEQATKARYWNIPIFYNDDEDYTIAITPNEPNNSLSIGDEHLDTIPATKSNEFIKSSVENLVLNPTDDDLSFSNDESFSDEDISKKIYSNPLFDEEIISMKIDPHHFNVESDLIESLLNQDSSIISFSSKIDSLLDEFAGELIPLKTIPPGIDKTDYDPKEEIHLIEKLFDPLMEEIDLFLASDGSIPSGIDNDYSDSEGDNLFLERLLHDDPIPLPNTLDFSNVVRVFLPFFTYLVTSSILLSSGSEDTIFDPGISNYHFSSLEPGVSRRSLGLVSIAVPLSLILVFQVLVLFEDTRSGYEYLNDLEEEYQARTFLAKSKRFFKNGTQRFSSAKAIDQTECRNVARKHKPKLRPTKDFEAKYNKVKAKLALLSSSASASKAVTIKNKVLIVEAYEWDKQEASSNDNEMVEVKVLMSLAEKMMLSAKKAPEMVNGKQIPSQKKIILGVDQLTEDPSSSGQKDLVFVKSSVDDTKVSIPGVERPWLSEAEGFILPNHDTGRILPIESQRNTTFHSDVATYSSVTMSQQAIFEILNDYFILRLFGPT
nr:hypothetical protein [Tanacetum cinerariifolium]